MVEEKKQEVGGSGCMCQHVGTCEGGMHRFCFRRCCMWKSLIAALVLAVVFCAGVATGHDGHRGRFEHKYRGHHMMERGGSWGGQYQYQGYYPGVPVQGQVNVMYRTIGTSTTAVPSGMPMMIKQVPQ